jgi:hypothetical protein
MGLGANPDFSNTQMVHSADKDGPCAGVENSERARLKEGKSPTG